MFFLERGYWPVSDLGGPSSIAGELLRAFECIACRPPNLGMNALERGAARLNHPEPFAVAGRTFNAATIDTVGMSEGVWRTFFHQ